jgi:alkylation response protein AidB-like acyl-CoA dehydrogenase
LVSDKEQRERFIPKLITADTLGCFAITEANTGSDVASMKTTAQEAEDAVKGIGIADKRIFVDTPC